MFFAQSLLLGVGLAMDAFSVSIANGLREPKMRRSRMSVIAGVYAFFQFLMPMIGWLCVHTAAEKFEVFQRFIPWIALILLAIIGGQMLWEGIRALKDPAGKNEEDTDAENPEEGISFGLLMMQGVATAIDALSVGFTIDSYRLGAALVCSAIIAVVTYLICMAGLIFGKRFGMKLADRATIVGGLILIGIGIKIFFS